MTADALAALAALVGTRLKAQGLVAATAESCTGGWVAQALTAMAGSSDWFERGYVSYSNAAKREQLGVTAATLERYGAVSEETAREMALGAARLPHGRACHHRNRRPHGRHAREARRDGVLRLGEGGRRDERDAALRRRPGERAPPVGGARAAGFDRSA